jgi:zinc protease
VNLRPIRLPPVHAWALGNGLNVQLVPHARVPLVAMRMLLRAGSDADPKGREGLADLTAQLLRRGTKRRSARALDEAIEQIGGSLGIGCGADWLALRISAPSAYLDRLLALLAEVIRSPKWDASELRSTRARALAEIASDRDDPEWVVDRALARQVWGLHPYGKDGSGTLASVARIRRSDVAAFHEQWLGPRVGLLTIVGDIQVARAAAAVRRAFGGWRGGPAAPVAVRAAPPSPGAGKVLWIHRKDLSQSQIRIGWQAALPPDSGALPAILVNHVLGGSFVSRLVLAARVRRGLTYGIGSHLDWRVHGTSHEVSTSTATAQTGKMINVILDEISALKARGPRAQELAAAKQAIVGLYPASLERNESIASKLGDVWLFGLPGDWIERYRERVAAVSRADAARAAGRVLSPHPPAIVVVGNASRAARQLRALGPVKVVPLTEYA